MKFGITQETNLGFEKSNLVNELSNSIGNYFESKIYGNSVEEILIGLICVRPEFDPFFKLRGLKFRVGQSLEIDTGNQVELRKSLSFDIKLDFNHYSNMSKELFKRALVQELFISIEILDKLPKKIKNFDRIQFKEDFKKFLKEKYLE